ncbi:hypothetical protein LguiA_033983 [Lonicera macranthoides]
MVRFVSNLTGSSMLEIFALSLLIPVFILMRHSFSFNGRIKANTKETSLKKNDNAIIALQNWKVYMVTVAVDFLCIVLPIIIFLTVSSSRMDLHKYNSFDPGAVFLSFIQKVI